LRRTVSIACASIGLILFVAFIAANAFPGFFYANYHQRGVSYGVRGSSTVNSNFIYDLSGVACFLAVVQPNGDWLQIGVFQGHTPGGAFYEDPQYYCDWLERGSYGFLRLGAAPVGTNHQYHVYSTVQLGEGIWYALRDGTVYNRRYLMLYDHGEASGQCESHDTRNSLEFHHWGLSYANWGLRFYPFDNTYFYQDWPPYSVEIVSETEYYSHGQGDE
jgi:hypothetical protein